jgi:hypothetical protein
MTPGTKAKTKAVVRAAARMLEATREILPPNRALVLFERTGTTWHPVRAHAWHAGESQDRTRTTNRRPKGELAPHDDRV